LEIVQGIIVHLSQIAKNMENFLTKPVTVEELKLTTEKIYKKQLKLKLPCPVSEMTARELQIYESVVVYAGDFSFIKSLIDNL
jgi:hypothetical protein